MTREHQATHGASQHHTHGLHLIACHDVRARHHKGRHELGLV